MVLTNYFKKFVLIGEKNRHGISCNQRLIPHIWSHSFVFWYGNRQWFKFKGFVSIVIVGVRVPLNIGAGVELMFELLCYFDLYSPIDWI